VTRSGPPESASTEKRRRAHRWGLSAETRAIWYLRLKAYRILARRFKVGGGEIDIIARKGRLLVFIEVKARTTLGDALEAVDGRSQRRIEAAASTWGQKYPYYERLDWRFDIIAIVPGRWPHHIIDAFRPGD
jgi:putative endonuclease